jgi:hypothetical protein
MAATGRPCHLGRGHCAAARDPHEFGELAVNDPGTTPACARDYHLFGPGPKRILALDGGGVRGAISVAFLERIEAVLAENLGKPVRLGDYFDFIGGTSTGAIIAGALALGYTTEDIRRFYLELAPKVFKRSPWRILGHQSKFDAKALREEIEDVVGDITLGSTELITGLCVVSKRMDTGSPWILANNPKTPFWRNTPANPDTKEDGFIGNEHYKLARLVRASTAAPFFFEPEAIEIADGEKPGHFVDGGVTPHNNPSLMLFLMTVLKCYKLNWRMGPEHLTICSIGTGSARQRVVPDELGIGRNAKLAIHALTSLMNDVQTFVLVQMQYLGKCLTPWSINAEIKDLADESPPHGKMFTFLRYDVTLELKWIETLGAEVEEKFGRKLTEEDLKRMRRLDDPTTIEDIYKLAQIAAKKQVNAKDWLGQLPSWTEGMQLPPARPRGSATNPRPAPESRWTRFRKTIGLR